MAKLPKLKYVKFVRAKGKIYAYFNTGKKLGGKMLWTALPPYSSVGFQDSYTVLLGHRTRRANRAMTIAEAADEFEASAEFARLSAGTRKYYSIGLKRIKEQLGEFPLDRVERRHVREIVNNRLSGNGARNAFLSVIGVLYTFCRRRDLTEGEPTKDIKAFPVGQHEPWPEELLEAGLRAEHERTRLAISLLYYTGQRIGDVVQMRWSDIRNGAIVMTQQKTGKRMQIPLARALEEELARLLASPPSAQGLCFDLGMWMLKNAPSLIADVEALRGERDRLREALHWREDALRHAQGRFLNINIALTTDRGKAVNQAIQIADLGEDACKMALARETLPVQIARAALGDGK